MIRANTLKTIVALCLSVPTIASAVVTTTVPGDANIFSAGLSTPQSPGGDGAGTLPIQISILPDLVKFQFQATGTVNLGGGNPSTGPDGFSDPFAPMNISSLGGVSGYFGPGFALCGVFLTAAAPSGSPPPTLDFTGNNQHPAFLTLSPALGQVFFIGDGQAFGGLGTQTFNIPAGATRLFLGMPDCNNASGPPGFYGDNSGSLSVMVSQVPEPAVGSIALCATLFVAARRRRASA